MHAYPAPRLAVPGDIPELVRLAGLMYEALGMPVDPGWAALARDTVAERLGSDTLVVFVVDGTAPGALASSCAACIGPRLPGPGSMARTMAYVQWMITDPAHRRRGLGRAVLTALLAELASRGVDGADLNASDDGVHLYRSLGFRDPPNPQLRLNLHR